MAPKQQMNLRMDADLMDGLRRVRDEVGIPVSEQIRRAIRAWLAHHKAPVAKKTARTRDVARTRA